MMSSVPASIAGLHVHWIFGGLLLFGFVAALVWLHRFGEKHTFLQTVWWTLAIGAIGVLLTSSLGFSGWTAMMRGHHGGRFASPAVRSEMMDYMQDKFGAQVGEDSMRGMMEEMFEHMDEEYGK